MNFQPAVPLSGIAGLRFLERTEPAQRAAFERSPLLAREVEDFSARIAGITSAEELVQDRQLLKVALGAFGLQDDLDKRAFVRKILEDGTEEPRALANRLVDPRYRQFSEAFGFGNISGARTSNIGFASHITDAYKTREFEIAVGETDNALRLALNFKREISDYANSPSADSTAWFSVLGSTPVRSVFEAAYNLPQEFGGLNVDRQRDLLRERTDQFFGDVSLAVFKDPANVDEVVDRFLARAQIDAGPTAATAGFSALTLLQSGSIAPLARTNLILSNL